MIHVVHQDEIVKDNGGERRQTEEAEEQEAGNSVAEVMVAVRAELKDSREGIVTDVQERALPAIEAAVKKAMQGIKAKGKQPKRKRKHTTFKSKGNERRYEDNEEIMETIEEAIEEIGENNLDAAKKSLAAGMKLLSKQRKLIKMADRETNGWEVVRHYVSDDLADDSDDEKDIRRARREALASIKKRNIQRSGNYFRNDYRRNYRGNDFGASSSSQSTGSGGYPTKGSYRNNASLDRRGVQICYYCGKEGHMQYACPSRYTKREY